MAKRELVEKVSNSYRNRLRECRLKAMIAKQEDLSKLTGINRTTKNALENNRIFLSSHYALLISDALKCSLDELFEKLEPNCSGKNNG